MPLVSCCLVGILIEKGAPKKRLSVKRTGREVSRMLVFNKVPKIKLSHRGEVCLVLGFLSRNFLFYF